MNEERWQRRLKWIVLATVAGSVLHYIDNLLFFAQYPEPVRINRTMIDAFWFVMTPLAWLGYRWIKAGSRTAGTIALMSYAGCNLLTLGHYRYAPMCSIGLRIHAFIWLEAILACVLAVYLVLPYFKRAAA